MNKTDLSNTAAEILRSRYLKRNEHGQISEDITDMFIRVASSIAVADKLYYDKSADEADITKSKFYDMMTKLLFLPNSPTLMNAGTVVGQLFACFVLPVNDSIEEIFDSVKHTAMIHKTGGGTGFDFSRIRAKGDIVKSTGGEASGPISFMRIFNAATEEIKQGGRRRGANMGILRIDHPDILEFIKCKDNEHSLNNFNISVAVTDAFMSALEKNSKYLIYDPKNKKPVGSLMATEVFELLTSQSWKNGEPGMIFIDKINSKNPTPFIGSFEATNPCGEQPLLPYESCVLGSINLERFVKNSDYDYKALKDIIHMAVHFLDNTIDMNRYPIKKIEDITKGNRKIGLGVMGFANSLALMGISYKSDAALKKAETVMQFINENAKEASSLLADSRGSFPNHPSSIYDTPMRNATVTTIAPTGTISLIANTSAGVEPLFGVVYRSNRADRIFYEINPVFDKYAKQYGFYSDSLYDKILSSGTIHDMDKIPDEIKKLFPTSGEIDPIWHIKMQAAFQKYTDNAVSKTINFKKSATIKDIQNAFLMAYQEGCKGLTVYRDGSRMSQVLTKGSGLDIECLACSDFANISKQDGD